MILNIVYEKNADDIQTVCFISRLTLIAFGKCYRDETSYLFIKREEKQVNMKSKKNITQNDK